MRLLVLNCYSRNSLAIVKALDPSIEIFGGAVERDSYLLCRPDRFFRHRRIKSIVRHRSPSDDFEGFKSDIIEICRRLEIDGVMASGTVITNSLSMAKHDIEAATGAKALVEDYKKLEMLTDKWFTYEMALELDIPVPHSVLLDGTDSMDDRLAELSYPVVAKPRKAYAAIGVHFFSTHDDLRKWLSDIKLDGSYMVQEKVDGALHDVTSCAQQGRVLSLLSQQRLKSLYDFGGGGIVNITTDEPEPREYARRILEHFKWNGAAEFDFMKTEDGRYFLIECNPKIWGTTFLTVAAGLNVPQQTVDVFLGSGDVPANDDYEVGLLYRWLFPECVFNWIQRPRNLSTLKRRISETFDRHGAKRVMSNLNIADMPHLVGIILDKAEL